MIPNDIIDIIEGIDSRKEILCEGIYDSIPIVLMLYYKYGIVFIQNCCILDQVFIQKSHKVILRGAVMRCDQVLLQKGLIVELYPCEMFYFFE